MKFKYPVYFITTPSRLKSWKNKMDLNNPPNPNKIPKLFMPVLETWILQTYIFLKRKGCNIYLIDEPKKNAINITLFNHFKENAPLDYYIVMLRTDEPPKKIAEKVLVQNKHLVKNKKTHFINFWPQPGLIPRDKKRKNKIKNIGFFGPLISLHDSFKTKKFKKELKKLGVILKIKDKEWWDYSNIDIVLAARFHYPKIVLNTKPSSKLINAWKAGCPAILYPEKAFEELKKNNSDYLKIENAKEAINQIRFLKNNSKIYEKMIKNGIERSKKFTQEKITQMWIDVISGPITKDFKRWKAQKILKKQRRKIKFIIRKIQNKIYNNLFHMIAKIQKK